MNQRENKAEAERLTEAVEKQLELIVGFTNEGRATAVQLTNLIGVAQLTASKAQVHATLATIPDPMDPGLGPL